MSDRDLPAPLTPPECDLRDFAYMPLEVRRLRDSSLAALQSPEECWSAVLLWGASWHQVPAASLPDDDRVLAQLAGYGRVVQAWLKVKPGALRGFVLCSDGRLYHPVVAEKARDAWAAKLERRWRTECARIKKHNQRTGEGLPYPRRADVLGDSGVMSPQCPRGHGVQGTEKGRENLHFVPPVAVDEEVQRSIDRIWRALPIRSREVSSPGAVCSAVLQLVAGGTDHRALTLAVESFCASPRARDKDGQYVGKAHEWLLLKKGTSWEAHLPTPEAVFRDRLAPHERQALDDVRKWQCRPSDWLHSWGPAPDRPGCQVPAKILEFCGVKPLPSPGEAQCA